LQFFLFCFQISSISFVGGGNGIQLSSRILNSYYGDIYKRIVSSSQDLENKIVIIERDEGEGGECVFFVEHNHQR
jgi:hypothetical protein